MLETLTAGSFTPHIGTAFRLEPPGGGAPGGHDLTLASATPMGAARRGGKIREHAFSVVFLGPSAAAVLPQAIYALEHEGLGRLEVFLVPIGRDGDRVQYEAVFN